MQTRTNPGNPLALAESAAALYKEHLERGLRHLHAAWRAHLTVAFLNGCDEVAISFLDSPVTASGNEADRVASAAFEYGRDFHFEVPFYVRSLSDANIVVVISGVEAVQEAATTLGVAEHVNEALKVRQDCQRTLVVETAEGPVSILNASHRELREFHRGEFHPAAHEMVSETSTV